jgi:hypothetical protein
MVALRPYQEAAVAAVLAGTTRGGFDEPNAGTVLMTAGPVRPPGPTPDWAGLLVPTATRLQLQRLVEEFRAVDRPAERGLSTVRGRQTGPFGGRSL